MIFVDSFGKKLRPVSFSGASPVALDHPSIAIATVKIGFLFLQLQGQEGAEF